MAKGQWRFWVDQGGTFTDFVAVHPEGRIITRKLLSDNPEHYESAVVAGIEAILGEHGGVPIAPASIAEIKLGTTVGTNALLERTGDRPVLAITKGFGDALRIAYQDRPEIFAREIRLPEPLYGPVLEVDARMDAEGKVLRALDPVEVRERLATCFAQGHRALAVVLMHGHRNPEHEVMIGTLAQEVGFTQVSLSHGVMPLSKLIYRGDTTVVDAYLSPLLQRYLAKIHAAFPREVFAGGQGVYCMQSHGGLVAGERFRGPDSVLSGPAGGIVGAVKAAQNAGFEQIIAFDMGGTSTDVAHYAGTLERRDESVVAGVRLRTPMLAIHTVAAGGGSLCRFADGRYQVGPASAGANPGPRAYGRHGPLTITDCNVMVGKLHREFFPQIFGPHQDAALDVAAVYAAFARLAEEVAQATGESVAPEEIAESFIAVAVENMGAAIKNISIQQGRALSPYCLCAYGGASGQHACLLARHLGIETVLIHPLAGVLSAYGVGIAEVREIRQALVQAELKEEILAMVEARAAAVQQSLQGALAAQGVALGPQPEFIIRLQMKYVGTDTTLACSLASVTEVAKDFREQHLAAYGFVMPELGLWIESLEVEAVGRFLPVAAMEDGERAPAQSGGGLPDPEEWKCMRVQGAWRRVPVYRREALPVTVQLAGPAIVLEETGTIVIEEGWTAEMAATKEEAAAMPSFVLRFDAKGEGSKVVENETRSMPLLLEVFGRRFMAIAEEMGAVLRKTAHSVNIKERLDFSCAVFDGAGRLAANAPHVPVHLGSMQDSVQAVQRAFAGTMASGQVYVLNDPYSGGTHLPDITVVTPVFVQDGSVPDFYVASRGHHADVGGIAPGSMPAVAREITEEGVLIAPMLLVDANGCFLAEQMREILLSGPFPVRNVTQNLADLQAQVAANALGVRELQHLAKREGVDRVQGFMDRVRANACASVQSLLQHVCAGAATVPMDHGAVIQVAISPGREQGRVTVDFTGTSPMSTDNFNAPPAVVKAAVLYVFRLLLAADIPLNAGVLAPVDLIVPEGSMLDPSYPAAVSAGNVETSQAIVDALLAALGAMAASAGTMNNLSFGNARYQYYETIAGGSGAGPGFTGASAVQTHMTNSRLTDPEILEQRYPVRLERFAVRHGSGGEGRWSGGDGVERELCFLVPMEVSLLTGRRIHEPFGLMEGEAGCCGENWLVRGASGERVSLPSASCVRVEAGDRLLIKTPGGGGWGKKV